MPRIHQIILCLLPLLAAACHDSGLKGTIFYSDDRLVEPTNSIYMTGTAHIAKDEGVEFSEHDFGSWIAKAPNETEDSDLNQLIPERTPIDKSRARERRV